MTLSAQQLDLRFPRCTLALSARRLWEHTEYGQVNPFAPIPSTGPVNPRLYIDIVNMSGPVQILAGLTLHDGMNTRHAGVMQKLLGQLLQHIGTPPVRQWLADVEAHIVHARDRQTMRAMPEPFLQQDAASPFGVEGLHSALKNWLDDQGHDKASTVQWQQRLDALVKASLRADEVAFSGFADGLARDGELTDHGHDADDSGNDNDSIENEHGSHRSQTLISGDALTEYVRFDALHLSILPVMYPASAQLAFERVPANARIKRLKPKLRAGLKSLPQWRDPALGYWIDLVEWADLLGPTRGWMAFTHRGEPVTDAHKTSGLCTTLAEAKQLANLHARKHAATVQPSGEAPAARLPGDAGYSEWVVTLPHYSPAYFSRQFEHRNALLGFRCDERGGPDGQRVLLLQDLRSEWARLARKKKTGEVDDEDTSDEQATGPLPLHPWLNEWPALALKLLLLHAASNNVDVVAWMPGHAHVMRHGGTGKTGLLELYDRILPEEATRLLRPFGKECTQVELYHAENYYIEPEEAAYRVFDQHGKDLGSGADWTEAQALVPKEAYVDLMSMHGIVLDEEFRQAIRADGFCAWGNRIPRHA
jgi:hypothetical protein